MILQMNCFPGLGLGRNHQGIAEFPNILVQHYPFGLGYKPTVEVYAQKAKEARAMALAKKEGGLFPMKKLKIQPTMNNYWVRKGDDFPFCGFPEPFVDTAAGKILPGLEIFFDLETNIDSVALSGKGQASRGSEKEKDWADYVDSTAMEFLFNHVDQMDWYGADAVIMLETAGASS